MFHPASNAEAFVRHCSYCGEGRRCEARPRRPRCERQGRPSVPRTWLGGGHKWATALKARGRRIDKRSSTSTSRAGTPCMARRPSAARRSRRRLPGSALSWVRSACPSGVDSATAVHAGVFYAECPLSTGATYDGANLAARLRRRLRSLVASASCGEHHEKNADRPRHPWDGSTARRRRGASPFQTTSTRRKRPHRAAEAPSRCRRGSRPIPPPGPSDGPRASPGCKGPRKRLRVD